MKNFPCWLVVGLLFAVMAGLISACSGNTKELVSLKNPIVEITPTPTATWTPTPTPLPVFEYYIVQPGDTLWALAERYGVDVETLLIVNEMKDPTALKVGQRILISDFVKITGEYLPTPTVTPTPTATPIPCPEGCRYAVPGCEIKGIYARIDGAPLYVLPEDEFYPLREADVWFCSEESAVRAGWSHWGE